MKDYLSLSTIDPLMIIAPIYIILCLVFLSIGNQSERDLRKHAFLVFPIYLCVVIGLLLYGNTGPKLISALMIMIGNAILVGWVVSPGGFAFLIAPFRTVLTKLGFRCVQFRPFAFDDTSMWGRSSTQLAVLVLILLLPPFVYVLYIR